jgi:hypothetical protein
MNLPREDLARIYTILKLIRMRYNKYLTTAMRNDLDRELNVIRGSLIRELINEPQKIKQPREYGG